MIGLFGKNRMARLWRVVVLALLVVPGVRADSGILGNNRLVLPGLGDTMNWASCMEYSHSKPIPVQNPEWLGCCKVECDGDKCWCPWPNDNGKQMDIEYWEPSAMIEVSCRNGYSLMQPGMKGRGNAAPQSCVMNNGRWFFEARVWALNGYKGGARHQSSGGDDAGEGARQCEQEGDDTKKKEFWGYGIKYDKFNKGPANGPGQSWEAYISDNDKTWAEDSGAGAKTPPNQGKCQGKPDVANCWGPVSGASNGGWVSAPTQSVAAALVMWRAHSKALQNKMVSPPGSKGYYKINMDYPFIMNASPQAKAMGFSGSSHRGSGCFQSGDPGPWWYTAGQQNLTPDKLPDFIRNLKPGTAAQAAEIHPGVYVFTVWVYTKCRRFTNNGHRPVGMCQYQADS